MAAVPSARKLILSETVMWMRNLMAIAMIGQLGAATAVAAEPASCKIVRMSDPGWSDIASTNAIVGTILKGLGYEQKVDFLSVPVTYRSIADGRLDVFLGNWIPAQTKFVAPLEADGKLEVIHKNLDNLRFTLAVPSYVAAAGVHSVDDLAKHADEFDHKIYGIESGAPINQNIRAAINAGDYGLSNWELVESGEQAMLAQVDRLERRKKWIAFVAWEPHPMNTKFHITYLAGGEKTFGPHFGASSVFTVGRANFTGECPNLSKLFKQITFTVPMENEIMAKVADGETPEKAALDWLKANPATWAPWFAGVTTLDGHREGLPAVRASLDLP